MIDIPLIILTTYFFGKRVAAKGYDAYLWRFRHVMACIFTEALVGLISLGLTGDLLIAGMSGLVALIGIVVFRYQRLTELPDKTGDTP